jgi:hypothetical protein
MDRVRLEFEPEDFNELARVVQENPGDGRIARECAFGIAQRRLNEMIEKSLVVYSRGESLVWSEVLGKQGKRPKTHTARLVNMEQLFTEKL